MPLRRVVGISPTHCCLEFSHHRSAFWGPAHCSGIMINLTMNFCTRCGLKDYLNADSWCDDCHAEMCEDSLNQEGLDYVQLRTSYFINDFVKQAWEQLRVVPRKFKYATRPFSLDALRTLRRYILFHHPGISMGEILQTKGLEVARSRSGSCRSRRPPRFKRSSISAGHRRTYLRLDRHERLRTRWWQHGSLLCWWSSGHRMLPANATRRALGACHLGA